MNRYGLLIATVSVIFFLWLIVSNLAPENAFSQIGTVWTEDFNNNSEAWNYSLAVSGARWCDQPSGLWLMVEYEKCKGSTETSPFGNIVIDNGTYFFSSASDKAFPYIWTNVDLSTLGDFTMELRLKFLNFATHGSGVYVRTWDDPSPEGENNPFILNEDVDMFSSYIWGNINRDGSAKVIEISLNGIKYEILNNITDYHTYTIRHSDNRYSLEVDGVNTGLSSFSSEFPNTIWLGNPYFTKEPSLWSSFVIDFIRISRLPEESAPDQASVLNLLFPGRDSYYN